ncbi:hypothetical protein CFOL_v3_02086, partial [Cephalotus follicularis]
VDFGFTTSDNFNLDQWFSSLGWKDYFTVNAPFYVELVKEFYSNMFNVSKDCDNLEIKTTVSRTVIKFDDKLLGEILGVPATGSKFVETKKWPKDPELVLELPYAMVITKILTHFGIMYGNEIASKLHVGDIYNASSLKRMGWKRKYEAGKGNFWLPKEGGRRKMRVEGKGLEEQGEAQRARPTLAPQASSSSISSLTLESLFC